MKRVLLTIPAFLIVIATYLTILLGLVRVTLMIGEIPAGVARITARCGEMALAVVVLLGGTALATRLAVWIFRPADGTERAEILS